MKILVTGGSGFIGSHLVNSLLMQRNQVFAIRRTNSKTAIELCRQPIWLSIPIFDLTLKDLEGIDIVMHLASAGVSPQKASWAELEKTNVSASLYLLELSINAGVSRFISVGTCLEYGEECNNWKFVPPNAALRPNSPYAASKAAGFLLLSQLAKSSSIEFYYGRIFTAFGEGQFINNLWPSLRRAALSGEDFSMTDGRQIRDFIPVEDVVSHLCFATKRTDLVAGIPFVVNIGSGIGLSVLDFAKKNWLNFGAKGNLLIGTKPTQDKQISRMVADTINLLPHASTEIKK